MHVIYVNNYNGMVGIDCNLADAKGVGLETFDLRAKGRGNEKNNSVVFVGALPSSFGEGVRQVQISFLCTKERDVRVFLQ